MKSCRYKRLCAHPGPGCSDDDEDTCPAAISLYTKFCPLMVTAGVNRENCTCNIEQIRKLWPKKKKCFEGQECLPRKHKTVQVQIGKIVDANLISASFTTA